jgi:hypothetical protein
MIVKGTRQLGSFRRGINLYIPKNIATPELPIPLNGLKLWLKADAGVSLSGSNVTAWADQSGQNNNLSVTTTNPVFENNVINGKPAIKFDGGRLDGTNIVTAKTIYAVIKTLASQPSQYAAILEATGGSLYSAVLGNTWGSYFSIEIPANTTISANTAAVIASISNDGISYEFRLNGQNNLTESDGEGFVSRSALYIGNDGSTGQPANVYVSEIIIYDNLISAEDITKIENYLNSKYAIY